MHKRNIVLKQDVANGQQDKVDKITAFELEKQRIEEKYTPLIQ